MSSILIAEDDPAIREGLEAALQSDGHETRAAANGVEALARIAERRPDLLLLDVMMPGKSGWDVCAELRRRDPALPIVFLTAKGEEADKVLGLGLGADDYVVKPFGVRGLFWKICGHGVAGIDGFYPDSSFEIYHTMGVINPDDPVGCCDEIEQVTGVPTVCMDANDFDQNQLGKCSDFPLTDEEIQDAMADNPSGQGDELTPLILIRPLETEK